MSAPVEGPSDPPYQRPHPATLPVCSGAKRWGPGKSWLQDLQASSLGNRGALYGAEGGKWHDPERNAEGVNWGVVGGSGGEGDRLLNYSLTFAQRGGHGR